MSCPRTHRKHEQRRERGLLGEGADYRVQKQNAVTHGKFFKQEHLVTPQDGVTPALRRAYGGASPKGSTETGRGFVSPNLRCYSFLFRVLGVCASMAKPPKLYMMGKDFNLRVVGFCTLDPSSET